MEDITKIYSKLKKYLSEIIISPRRVKTNIEVGEDNEGIPIFEEMDSVEVLFNNKQFYLFKKELNNILSEIEEVLYRSKSINNIENLRVIEQIINELIEIIETREVFIIKHGDDNEVEDFQLPGQFISQINEKLTNHRNCIWDYKPKSMNGNIIEDSPVVWRKSKTDLLELVTALLEIKAIDKNGEKLSRKEATEIFSKFFNIDITDRESLLSHANDRSDESPFLTSLKESFKGYLKGLSQRQESRYKGRKYF